MAVYTDISDDDLDLIAGNYPIGEILSCKGIAEGVENSNFLLHSETGHFILTIYEKRVNEEDLPFFLGLMEHLADHGYVSPRPVKTKSGESLSRVAGKPAALIEFLEGRSMRRVSPEHCALLGRSLADLHIAGDGFQIQRPNSLTIDSWRPLFEASLASTGIDLISKREISEISTEIGDLEKNWPENLPEGVIHADLFPDNIFFLNGQVSGVIDYYFACNDFLAYDIAVCLNAWCFESDASFNITKARRLLNSYQRARPLEKTELQALPLLSRGAAMRFYLTRLYDWINQIDGALVKPKDPSEYLQKIRFLRDVKSVAEFGIDLP
ncbi:homoserine kinase [Sneathiella sp.]|jgi:homoserine kinase type II|uniref:homoserine kinase n=1 Tax=Sneathiella sp. TaxID=1964365 RepID=UPI0039E72593